jgi:hypothetical protein
MNINTQSVLKAAGIGAAINAMIGILSLLSLRWARIITILVWPLYCCCVISFLCCRRFVRLFHSRQRNIR